MTQPQGFLLANRNDLSEAGVRGFKDAEVLALGAHRRFELERMIEIIDQARFAAAGDEDNLLDSRLPRFIHRILDQRPVDDRQHLLGDRLGRGQKARAEPRDWKHGFANFTGHSG